MRKNRELTDKQKIDVANRMQSFKDFGILPASQVRTHFKTPLTSSEQRFLPFICFNCIDTSSNLETSLSILESHDTHGFINMAIERPVIARIASDEQLREVIEERLLCSFILVTKAENLKPARHKPLVDFSHPMTEETLEVETNLEEFMVEETLEAKKIIAVLAPFPLVPIAKKIFSDYLVIAAPWTTGMLQLSVFTLITALNLAGSVPHTQKVTIPDYKQAFRQLTKHISPGKYALHISRTATQLELSSPYHYSITHNTDKDMSDLQTMGCRQFSDENPNGRFTPSDYNTYTIQKKNLPYIQPYLLSLEDKKSEKGQYTQVRIQADLLKKEENGGMRELLELERFQVTAKPLTSDILRHLQEEHHVTIEKNGSKLIVTYPQEFSHQVRSLILNPKIFKEQCAALVVQSLFRQQSAINKLHQLRQEKLEQLKAQIIQLTREERFLEVGPLVAQAQALKERLQPSPCVDTSSTLTLET